MKNLLKEYVNLFLEAFREPTSFKDFADQIGGKYNTKYGAHIRFQGTPEQLRAAVGKRESSIAQPNSGDPLQRSGKYPTYVFDFTDESFKLPRGEVLTVVPIVLIDHTKKDFLSSGKMLGYGAEHAVYAAIKRTDMFANMEKDTRLKDTLKNSNQQHVDNFVANCELMKAAFKSQIKSMGLSNLKTDSAPPSGGNVAVDVPAFAILGSKKINYDIHVKYQSDRLVGLQLPKRQKGEDPKNFAERLQNHPNKIYRMVRDEMIQDLQTRLHAAYDINDIFQDKDLRGKFYTSIMNSPFPREIDGALKSQLGYNDGTSSSSLLVNFEDPMTVNIKETSAASLNNFKFVLRMPAKPEQKISKAFIIDAVINSPTGRKQEVIQDVFELEIGSAERNRGLDVHKGTNYQTYVSTIEKLQ
ncbi:MAG: hypothetical protein EBU90_16865 [Proteobacteria bacterium]|nr:hypothetical protein [Pseudomonadota bacterium]